MATITKVALAGATGNLGPSILNGLLEANFQVTVLTRKSSTHTFPANVSVAPVDYESFDELVAALRGQDAVVSTLASMAIGTQLRLLEAAASAGVRRFIPSEFGSNTTNAKSRALPVFADKVKVQDALAAEAAKPNGMTYSLVLTGPFLDWGIRHGMLVNLKEKSQTLYDGGKRPLTSTSLPTIGRAVAGVLRHPDETRNRPVYVQEAVTTGKALSDMGRKATGAGDAWKETTASADALLQEAWAELGKPDANPSSFAIKFIIAGIFGEGYGMPFEKPDNELLGIKQLNDSELQALVDRIAKEG